MNLNQKNRKKIRDGLLKHAFLPKILQIGLDRQQLAFDVYEKYIRRERADGLSEPWVTRERVAFSVFCRDRAYRFDITGCLLRRGMREKLVKDLELPIWVHDAPGTDRKIALPAQGAVMFSADLMPTMTELHDELDSRELRLFEEIRQQVGVIEAMLNAHRTWDKLVKAWPEVEPFKPETVAVQAAKLPAPTDLNQSLGLPVGE